MSAVILSRFAHVAGTHCSSSSIRDVLAYDGHRVSEALVFGLGAGLGFTYQHDPAASPTHRFNGRAADLEGKFYRHVGRPLNWAGTWSPPAMAAVLQAGRPILAQTDIHPLPYYDGVHFPGHGIVIAGIDLDAGTVAVADTASPELLAVDLEVLRAAMSATLPPLLAPNRWAAAPNMNGCELASPPALRQAMATAAREMLAPSSPLEGLPALERLAESLPAWPEAPDWRWAARFGYQAVEKRGTGGGGFRTLYAAFLQEAAASLPALSAIAAPARMAELGRLWSRFAALLRAAFVEADPAYLGQGAPLLAAIARQERALFQELAQAAPAESPA